MFSTAGLIWICLGAVWLPLSAAEPAIPFIGSIDFQDWLKHAKIILPRAEHQGTLYTGFFQANVTDITYTQPETQLLSKHRLSASIDTTHATVDSYFEIYSVVWFNTSLSFDIVISPLRFVLVPDFDSHGLPSHITAAPCTCEVQAILRCSNLSGITKQLCEFFDEDVARRQVLEESLGAVVCAAIGSSAEYVATSISNGTMPFLAGPKSEAPPPPLSTDANLFRSPFLGSIASMTTASLQYVDLQTLLRGAWSYNFSRAVPLTINASVLLGEGSLISFALGECSIEGLDTVDPSSLSVLRVVPDDQDDAQLDPSHTVSFSITFASVNASLGASVRAYTPRSGLWMTNVSSNLQLTNFSVLVHLFVGLNGDLANTFSLTQMLDPLCATQTVQQFNATLLGFEVGAFELSEQGSDNNTKTLNDVIRESIGLFESHVSAIMNAVSHNSIMYGFNQVSLQALNDAADMAGSVAGFTSCDEAVTNVNTNGGQEWYYIWIITTIASIIWMAVVLLLYMWFQPSTSDVPVTLVTSSALVVQTVPSTYIAPPVSFVAAVPVILLWGGVMYGSMLGLPIAQQYTELTLVNHVPYISEPQFLFDAKVNMKMLSYNSGSRLVGAFSLLFAIIPFVQALTVVLVLICCCLYSPTPEDDEADADDDCLEFRPTNKQSFYRMVANLITSSGAERLLMILNVLCSFASYNFYLPALMVVVGSLQINFPGDAASQTPSASLLANVYTEPLVGFWLGLGGMFLIIVASHMVLGLVRWQNRRLASQHCKEVPEGIRPTFSSATSIGSPCTASALSPPPLVLDSSETSSLLEKKAVDGSCLGATVYTSQTPRGPQKWTFSRFTHIVLGIYMVVHVVLFIWGMFVPSIRLTTEGVAATLVDIAVGPENAPEYLVKNLTLWETGTYMGKNHQKGWNQFMLQVWYYAATIFIPLLMVISVAFLWYVPLTPRRARLSLFFSEFLRSLCGQEGCLIVVGLNIYQLENMTEFIVKNSNAKSICTFLEESLTPELMAAFKLDKARCMVVRGDYLWGFWFCLVLCFDLLYFSILLLRTAHAAMRRRGDLACPPSVRFWMRTKDYLAMHAPRMFVRLVAD